MLVPRFGFQITNLRYQNMNNWASNCISISRMRIDIQVLILSTLHVHDHQGHDEAIPISLPSGSVTFRYRILISSVHLWKKCTSWAHTNLEDTDLCEQYWIFRRITLTQPMFVPIFRCSVHLICPWLNGKVRILHDEDRQDC